MQLPHDIQVEPISDALKGYTLDVVISGSIGAVESVRFIRSLRRLGAKVIPWLTKGGRKFITPLAVSWAAGHETRENFDSFANHLASHDGLIVAPASANTIAKVAHGIIDTPSSSLIASYLSSHKPVMMLPNMHESLWFSPFIQENIHKCTPRVHFLPPREEEGKLKFPDAKTLADYAAHFFRKKQLERKLNIVVTMGTTRGYIDDVRYISNYSSGRLGSFISEELFRYGFETHVISGPAQYYPGSYTKLFKVTTNQEMEDCLVHSLSHADGGIFAAAILDFIPKDKISGKINSAEKDTLLVEFTRTKKLLEHVKQGSLNGPKIGFKLVSGNNDLASYPHIAETYMEKYSLSALAINDLSEVDANKHKAFFFEKGKLSEPKQTFSKQELASVITQHIFSNLIEKNKIRI